MFKLTCLALSVVSLSSIYAEESGAKKFALMVEECAKLHGVTMMELDSSMTKSDVSKIKPCFWGCAFTKAGFLNDQGQYDLDTGLTELKKFMMDPAGLEKLERIARICESVKDKDVSDGQAGCERGMLAAECWMEQLQLLRSSN